VWGYCSYADPVEKYEKGRACSTGKRMEMLKKFCKITVNDSQRKRPRHVLIQELQPFLRGRQLCSYSNFPTLY
jgi:hypothetical protein